MPIGSSHRVKILDEFIKEVEGMLIEKEAHYGSDGGFFSTNSIGNYDHALGEAKLKIFEYPKTKRLRDLIKAVTWLYLIYEAEKR